MGKVFTLRYEPVEGGDPMEARMGKASSLGPFRCGDYLDGSTGKWMEGWCDRYHETWDEALECLVAGLPGGGVDDIEFQGVQFTPIKSGAAEHADPVNWRPAFCMKNVQRKGGV